MYINPGETELYFFHNHLIAGIIIEVKSYYNSFSSGKTDIQLPELNNLLLIVTRIIVYIGTKYSYKIILEIK